MSDKAPATDERKADAAEERRAAKAAEEAVTAARQARGYHTAVWEGVTKFVSDHDGFECFDEAVLLDHLQAIGK